MTELSTIANYSVICIQQCEECTAGLFNLSCGVATSGKFGMWET